MLKFTTALVDLAGWQVLNMRYGIYVYVFFIFLQLIYELLET